MTISLAAAWKSLTKEERTTIYMLLNRRRGVGPIGYEKVPFVDLADVFEAIGEGQPYDFLNLDDRNRIVHAERVMDPAANYIKDIFREKGEKNRFSLLVKLGWNDRSIPTSKIFGDI